jgi:hypothetical protein
MKKKIYVKPQTDHIELVIETHLLKGSGNVTGNGGDIDFGGYDNNGLLDPQTNEKDFSTGKDDFWK